MCRLVLCLMALSWLVDGLVLSTVTMLEPACLTILCFLHGLPEMVIRSQLLSDTLRREPFEEMKNTYSH